MTFVETYYRQCCEAGSAMSAHLPRLRALAEGCALAVEFGVKRGGSSAALLLGAARVISYDIVATREAKALAEAAGGRWSYRLSDSRTAPIEPCDLLFVDSLHTYAQVAAELDRHADAVRRWLVFHDTITFGSVGADGESGQHLWTYRPGEPMPLTALGIRPAIDALMIRDPSWYLAAHHVDSHGLLVLERRA